MTIEYDKTVDAMYMRITKGKVSKTVRVNDYTIVDLDEEGNTLGIEILDASLQSEMIKMIQDNVFKGRSVTINGHALAMA